MYCRVGNRTECGPDRVVTGVPHCALRCHRKARTVRLRVTIKDNSNCVGRDTRPALERVSRDWIEVDLHDHGRSGSHGRQRVAVGQWPHGRSLRMVANLPLDRAERMVLSKRNH